MQENKFLQLPLVVIADTEYEANPRTSLLFYLSVRCVSCEILVSSIPRTGAALLCSALSVAVTNPRFLSSSSVS